MRHSRLAAALLLAAAAAARAAPAPDAPSPLAWVPAAAPLVLSVRGVENVLDRRIAQARNVSPERAKLVEYQKDMLFKDGPLGDHRVLKGLKKDGPLFVALLEPPEKLWSEEWPKVAVVAAVDDYAAFRDGLLTPDERKALKSEDGIETTTIEIEFILSKIRLPLFFVDCKDHAVVALRKDTARLFQKTGPGLDGRMTKGQQARLLAADEGAYLAVDAFSKEYPDQVKSARQGVEDALRAAEESHDPARRALAGVGRRAVGLAFQAAEDGRGLLLTRDYRPEGLAVHVEIEPRPGSATAGMLEGARPSAFADLGTLPAGQMLYAGVEPGPALSRVLDATVFADEPDAKEAKRLREALDAVNAAGPGTRLLACDLPPAVLEVQRYDDPGKAAAARARLAEALGAGLLVPAGILKEKPEVKAGAAKYKGFEVRSVRFTWDAEAMSAPLTADLPDPTGKAQAQSAAALKKQLGDGTTLWIGTDGKVVLQVAAPDWDAAEKRLDSYFKGSGRVGEDRGFQEVRRALPAEADIVAVLDAARYESALADVLQPLRRAYGFEDWKPPPAGARGYAGFTATLRPERAAVDAFVSTDALRYAHPWTFVWLTWGW